MNTIPKIFRFLKKNQYRIWWVYFTVIAISCVVLWRFLPEQYPRNSSVDATWLDRFFAVFLSAKGNLAEITVDSTWLQVCRLLLPIFITIWMFDIIVRVFIHFFTWLAINRLFCNHVIVFGVGEKGFALISEILNRGQLVVAIDKNDKNPYLEQVELRNGFTLVGDATDIKFLKTLGLHRAKTFYAMTGDDTINIECAVAMKEYFKYNAMSYMGHIWIFLCGFKRDLFTARIQVHNSTLRRLAWEKGGPFAYASLTEDVETPWVCYPFSAYDEAAKEVVRMFPPDIAGNKTKPYRIMIVGFGWFGEQVALQVIRMGTTPKSLGHELVIHVIDNQADLNRERFYRRYPAVDPDNAGDLRYGGYAPLAKMDFINGDIRRMNEKAVRTAVPDIDECTVVYVCLADELIGAETAFTLAKITQGSDTRIVFALPETERISGEMQQSFDPFNINMFFPLTESCSLAPGESQLRETVDNMGKAVKMAYDNKTIDSANKEGVNPRIPLYKSVAEMEEPWSKDLEWKRESSRQAASHVFFKLRMAGIGDQRLECVGKGEIISACEAQRELLAVAEHDRWCTERLLDGWIYGKDRDDIKRIHPDIQPFASLHRETQDIDFAINSIWPQVMEIWQSSRKKKNPSASKAPTRESIRGFTGDNAVFGNFHPAPITFDGIVYPSSEHAYQAAKFDDPEIKQKIASVPKPKVAKQYAHSLPLKPDWDSRKVELMRKIVFVKFSQHAALRERLLATDDAHLEEANRHGDTFWGTVDGVGENMMGKILMELRDHFRHEADTVGETFDEFSEKTMMGVWEEMQHKMRREKEAMKTLPPLLEELVAELEASETYEQTAEIFKSYSSRPQGLKEDDGKWTYGNVFVFYGLASRFDVTIHNLKALSKTNLYCYPVFIKSINTPRDRVAVFVRIQKMKDNESMMPFREKMAGLCLTERLIALDEFKKMFIFGFINLAAIESTDSWLLTPNNDLVIGNWERLKGIENQEEKELIMDKCERMLGMRYDPEERTYKLL